MSASLCKATEKEAFPTTCDPCTIVPEALYDSIDNAGHHTEHGDYKPMPVMDAGYTIEMASKHTGTVNYSTTEVNHDEETP